MIKKLHRLFLALNNNKVIKSDDLFIYSYDIKKNKYMFWYVDGCRLPRVFDNVVDREVADFKWNILMCKG